jgi:hypothetical protein
MSDTIIFMSAYDITRYSKSKLLHFNKKQGLDVLLDKHHLTYMLLGDKLISPKGALTLSIIHNTLVLSNEIDDVTNYFCDLIGIRELPSPLENISTTGNYEYYPQDGASVIKNYNPDDVDIPLYNGIMLESIKLYVYLFQIINVDITADMNKVVRNDLYLENLFLLPKYL